jgi:hypothetical protein
MVQTNQSRLFSADCYKDSYKDNFSFKIKTKERHFKHYRSNGALNFRDRFTLETVTPWLV